MFSIAFSTIYPLISMGQYLIFILSLSPFINIFPFFPLPHPKSIIFIAFPLITFFVITFIFWSNRVISLGCGNGKKGNIFINGLKDKIKIRYCPIDISGYMVEKAIENITKENVDEIVTFQWNVSDFENLENIAPLLRRGDFKRNLFLLLGNTFGNFETHEILYNITSGMDKSDYLLVGNGLNNGKIEKDIVKVCKNNAGFDKFLSLIPLQLGLDKNDLFYDVRFRHSRIEFYYTLLHDKQIVFQHRSHQFYKGDQIVVAVAYHYKKEDMIRYLKLYFKEVSFFVSKDGSYVLALCKK